MSTARASEVGYRVYPSAKLCPYTVSELVPENYLYLCTCHRLPRGGGPRADVGEYGDFMGTLQQISALVVGEMWRLRLIF